MPFERVADAQPKTTALSNSSEKQPLRLCFSKYSMPQKLKAHNRLVK